MSDPVSVLFANDAFYVAFATRDVPAMTDVWSRREALTCIHPGWAPLVGRELVLQSWRAILGNPDAPAIVCANALVRVYGDVAYVLCHEQLQQTFLVATNVFVREDGRWRLVHHQAGAAPPPEVDPEEQPQPLQ